MGLYLIADDLPEVTPRLVREACARRGIAYHEVDAATFDYDPATRLAAGDLLFRPSATLRSRNVEQFLYRAGVATYYCTADELFRDVVTPHFTLTNAGIRQPLVIPCATSDREVLDRHVAALGGLPVVLKLGGEGGCGTILLETWPGFLSMLDYCASRGLDVELVQYIPDAVHWRVVVAGGRAVAAYTNPVRPRDFRSAPSNDPRDYTDRVEPALGDLAVRATLALGVDFGGVDVLHDRSGTDWVLEVNCPCYFPQAQVTAGIDVAGAIVDALVVKASRPSP